MFDYEVELFDKYNDEEPEIVEPDFLKSDDEFVDYVMAMTTK